jgi:hypothetical protein
MPGASSPPDLELVRGTLDLLILKTLAWGPMHGLGVIRWIETTTRERLQIEEGALYPALHSGAGSARSGASPNATGRRGSTGSPRRAEWPSPPRPRSGIAIAKWCGWC